MHGLAKLFILAAYERIFFYELLIEFGRLGDRVLFILIMI